MSEWTSARRILAIRLDATGDVLMTTPALRALKGDAGERHVTLLTSPAGAAAAALVPEVDEVIAYEAPWMKASGELEHREHLELIERLRDGAFDAAVIFTVYSQNPLPAALAATLAGIPLRAAHCRENPYALLSDWVAEPEPQRMFRHEVRRQLDLVGHLGFRTDSERLSFRAAPAAAAGVEAWLRGAIDRSRPWAVVHPGASAASRRYPPEQFAEAVRCLGTEHGWQFVFTGSEEEAPLIEAIRSQSGATSVSLAGEVDLGELGALIEAAPMLIANNTGPAHIAAAVGTPVVSLYALTNPQHTPWRVPHRLLYEQVACAPCYRSVCPEGHHRCLEGVSAGAVVEAALDLTQRRAPGSALLVDLDGVLLDTEPLHRESTLLALDALRPERPLPPRSSVEMLYPRHALGLDRYRGMAALLEALGVRLPRGDEGDEAGTGTVGALANLKNRMYWSLLERGGVPVMAGARDLVHAARERGFAIGVVSSSRNAVRLLEAAELDALVDVVVSGADGLPAKPDPAPYRRAAALLGVASSCCVAIEDTPAGIRSARDAGVGRVIGLASEAIGTGRLLECGANDMVDGLGRLMLLRPEAPAERPRITVELDQREVMHT